MMRVICQFKLLTIIVLSFFVLSVKGQVYQEMPQYGYRANRMAFDSTLSIPTVCGVPTLKSNVLKKAAIAYDSCNGFFYNYNPKTLTWSKVTIDTSNFLNKNDLTFQYPIYAENIGNTFNIAIKEASPIEEGFLSTSNFIKFQNKVDTIYRTLGKDSIQFKINGRYHAIKDSTGGGGGSDTAKVVIAEVYNAEATTLNRGEIVYLYGANGDRASVKRASNKQDATSATVFGMVRENISAGAIGYITTQGQVGKLNLGAYTPGQIIYLDSIAGQFTITKPSAPYHGVFLGVIERANNGNGLVYIKPQNGYELGELHNVQVNGTKNASLLYYDSLNSLWKASTLSFAKNTTRDSIILSFDGKRYAVKDSIGTGGGGGGSPSGPIYSVQVNNNGVFGGSDQFSVNGVGGHVSIGNPSNLYGTFNIEHATSDYTNSAGDNTHIFLQNDNVYGQTSVYSEINQQPVAKWRTDYAGNINWIAYGGAHAFFTGGDYPDGTSKMTIFNNGNIALGENPSDNGNKFQVNGSSYFNGESYFYNENLTTVATFESGQGYPIQILTVDEGLGGNYTASKGSIGNQAGSLYENMDGYYNWRKMTRPYRSYVAQLSQAGTNAPVPTILEDEFTSSGLSVSWVRENPGEYYLTGLENAEINPDKVVVFFTLGTLYQNPMEFGYTGRASWDRENKRIWITTAYYDGNTTKPGFSQEDNLLSDGPGYGDDFWRASIEIRIYD